MLPSHSPQEKQHKNDLIFGFASEADLIKWTESEREESYIKSSPTQNKVKNTCFANTNWYGFYRTRNPQTKQLCIAKCAFRIDESGLIKLNQESLDTRFHNYVGSAFLTGRNQLFIELVYTNSLDYGYSHIYVSVPDLRKFDNETILIGIYIQFDRIKKAVRSGTIILNLLRTIGTRCNKTVG